MVAVGAVSFLVATLAMTAVLGLTYGWTDTTRPRIDRLPAVPWWGWLGGFVGATYVTSVFVAIPAIGAAPVMGLTVAGQQIAAILVDRYGWFRLPRHPLGAGRDAGVAAILAGVALITLA